MNCSKIKTNILTYQTTILRFYSMLRICTLQYEWKILYKENILLISSIHHDDEIDKTNNLQKPVIITPTKGAVDVVDKLTVRYNCARNMILLTLIVHIDGINSRIIVVTNTPSVDKLRRKGKLMNW